MNKIFKLAAIASIAFIVIACGDEKKKAEPGTTPAAKTESAKTDAATGGSDSGACLQKMGNAAVMCYEMSTGAADFKAWCQVLVGQMMGDGMTTEWVSSCPSGAKAKCKQEDDEMNLVVHNYLNTDCGD